MYVSIAGAGITGPSAALALARAGHDVTVYEQRPACALHSNGIQGITRANWAALAAAGAGLAHMELGQTYRDYGRGEVPTPFRLITWTDLHRAIADAARCAGARFVFGQQVDAAHLGGHFVIDAGGIATAAHRGLLRSYLGSIIYRGVSALHTDESFTTVKLPATRGFLDIGDTRDGAAWAFGVRRPEPARFGTTFTTTPPAETDELPAEFARIIRATPEIMVLPQARWNVAPACHDAAWQHYTLGDANGPVRPITTSGANLGIMAGLAAPELLQGSEDVASSLLARRAYAIDLGLKLKGPEIGGRLEDPHFSASQRGMYGDAS